MIPESYEKLWNDPAVVDRIDRDIEQHRKADLLVRVTDAAGKPAAGATVQVEQTASDFLFGANIFMLEGYDSPAINRAYEQMFTGLLNAATVPLYWKDLEPEQGRLRFEASSEPIARRPPPDVVVSFCEAHGLNMNGHCLVWDLHKHSIPDWLEDTRHCEPLLEKRIREIAERYGDRMHRWDVLNESLSRPNTGRPSHMPPNYERLVFDYAARHMPASAHLMINETTNAAWSDRYFDNYHRQIKALRADGAKIDGIGLQWHLFSVDDVQRMLAGETYQPATLLDVLDGYLQHGLPLHISEITLPCPTDDAQGRAIQARMTRDVYRLWFSHPAVHAVTWWNFPDGGAVSDENDVLSGLVEKDMSPKPAYEALDQLINHDWRTNTTLTTDQDGIARVRGFKGAYELRAGAASTTATLASDGDEARLVLEQRMQRP